MMREIRQVPRKVWAGQLEMVQHGHAQTVMMENVKMRLILGEWQIDTSL